MLLSDTARVHRKLKAAGVVADLNVYEGLSHAEYMMLVGSPENLQTYGELAPVSRRAPGVAEDADEDVRVPRGAGVRVHLHTRIFRSSSAKVSCASRDACRPRKP